MKCVLCGGSHFRDIEEGMWCKACGAIMGGSPDPAGGIDRDYFLDLQAEQAEDAAVMRDHRAVNGDGLDRSMGAL